MRAVKFVFKYHSQQPFDRYSNAPAQMTEVSAHGAKTSGGRRAALMVAAVGVVYGDIGTSPLYTIKLAFGGPYAFAITPTNVFGVLSLIFWALLLVVTVKYISLVMRADNKGEGGIMALMALAQRATRNNAREQAVLMTLGLVGAALFYGDGMITPAISVLSAVEGLHLATPAFDPYVIPIALTILVGLFMFQRFGTARVGAFFGPVMIVWFFVLALLGVRGIAMHPEVLRALNPWYGIEFFINNGMVGFLILGAVVLAVTGTEALYSDMGHFGRRPLQMTWIGFVLPALVLNYFGQGALLLADPQTVINPFYLLAPGWALYPMVALATVATIIASQAMITGVFSMTRQAIQLGYAPRMEIMHTSERQIGQIYVPSMNWALLVGVIVLVLGFHTSSNLAAAYGIAVTAVMIIDTILVFFIARRLWRWSMPVAVLVCAGFFVMDVSLFSANVTKIFNGGWFPIATAIVVYTLLTTWKRGRALMAERMGEFAIKLDPFVENIVNFPPVRVEGTAVFLTTSRDTVPHALLHNLKHNKVMHERVVILRVVFQDVPHIDDSERVEVIPLGNNFFKVIVTYGFKDEADIPRSLELCRQQGLECNMLETSFFLSRETLIATGRPGMALWREKIFVGMQRNAGSATAYFNIPTNRVVELGAQVEL